MTIAEPTGRVQMQRARGEVVLTTRATAGRTSIERLRQAGCAKLMLPRTHRPALEAVLLNTAGGLTGGDVLRAEIAAGQGAELVATSQTAERIYRAAEGEARVNIRLSAGPGAVLHWLPQETILFDGARLRRSLHVDADATATLMLCDAVVLGRAAMGETVRDGALSDQWRVRLGGRLVLAEALRLTPPGQAGGPGCLDGARGYATVVLAGTHAADRLGAVREALTGLADVRCGASAPDRDIVLVRMLAPEGQTLLRALRTLLIALRGGPLPRVWQN